MIFGLLNFNLITFRSYIQLSYLIKLFHSMFKTHLTKKKYRRQSENCMLIGQKARTRTQLQVQFTLS